MKNRLLQIFGGIALTLFGVAATAIFEYFRSHREISFYIQSDIAVINRDPFLGDVSVTYKSRSLSGLNKYSYIIKNTGSVPIEPDDIDKPIELTFPAGSPVLKVAIAKTYPENLRAGATTGLTGETTAVEVPLMNPGDWVEIAVYSEGAIPPPKLQGHIKGIQSLKVTDLRPTASPPTTHSRPWYYYVIALFTFLLLCFVVLLSKQAFAFLKFKRRLKKDPDFILSFPNSQALTHFISVDMDFIDDKDKNRLFSFASNEQLPFPDRLNQVSMHIKQAAFESSSGTEIWFFLMSVILLAGTLYVAINY